MRAELILFVAVSSFRVYEESTKFISCYNGNYKISLISYKIHFYYSAFVFCET